MMILGEVLNLIAYAVTSAVLVTPLGALSVVVSFEPIQDRLSSDSSRLTSRLFYATPDLRHLVLDLSQGEADDIRQSWVLPLHRWIYRHCPQRALAACRRSDQGI